MTQEHWNTLLKIINGEIQTEKPIGFIIDSPWLPQWYGVSILDYYTNDNIWFEANRKAVETFPEVMFFPGFWSEYGMCTEPSAFGSKMVWAERNLPHADKIIENSGNIGQIKKPNVKTDGLLPFMLNRLIHNEENIKKFRHSVKFAVARGPLNIASFLMGTTEFMMAISMKPEETLKGLNTITGFIEDWLSLQMETFPDIDGILLLDDIVGFVGESDFKEFALPFLKKIYRDFNVKVKFFHNDAHGFVCAPSLKGIGINLFNFSFEHGLGEMKELTGNSIVLLGNIPPRDVLAIGSVEDVKQSVKNALESVEDHSRIIWSCGGGMPPDVSTDNIKAFISAVRESD